MLLSAAKLCAAATKLLFIQQLQNFPDIYASFPGLSSEGTYGKANRHFYA